MGSPAPERWDSTVPPLLLLNVPEGGGGIVYTLAFMAMAFGPPILGIALVVALVWAIVVWRRRRGRARERGS
jgi:hypothetical protein